MKVWAFYNGGYRYWDTEDAKAYAEDFNLKIRVIKREGILWQSINASSVMKNIQMVLHISANLKMMESSLIIKWIGNKDCCLFLYVVFV